ncbi:MAG: hypothetical protein FJW40_07820 [Acidobacteria bacterium]|nr:hypothetical protein [Acidobacteriota bacterium]
MSARVLEGQARQLVEPFEWKLPGSVDEPGDPESEPARARQDNARQGQTTGAKPGHAAAAHPPVPGIDPELLDLIQRQAGRIRELEFETTRLQSELTSVRGEKTRAEASLEAAEQERARAASAAAGAARAEGFENGVIQTRRELDPLLSRLSRTIEDLALCRRTFRKEAEEDVVRLSVAIGRRILHRELAVDAAALQGLIRACLDKLDQRELHRVRLSPADRNLVEERLAPLGLPKRIEIVSDPALERGSVLFETARGTLDASIATQLEEIERGFIDHVRRQP